MLCGMVTDVRRLQPLNALLPMAVTAMVSPLQTIMSGMVTLLTLWLKGADTVASLPLMLNNNPSCFTGCEHDDMRSSARMVATCKKV